MFAAKIDTSGLLTYGSILMAAIAVLGLVVWVVRKRYLDTGGPSGGGVWSLQQLRDLRASGQLSEAEFQQLRAEMLGRYGSPAALTDDKTGVDAGTSLMEGNQIKEATDDSR